ncbi:flp pilus-assembly TadE/G-like family protein [Frankia sp. AgB1.9]|uniref:Rv3654c family TadE-like protein n=1 Tax=unclassified Frankia TaxID=2632575 RepID=UPI0019345298|nr:MULTISPECIES: Rv3654c family TadE-like protein [unclassified Frankia]MBL7493875.1 flp pilus-assembly TadE/G-like family protein [Frankia sp. AgW1.1]MBL7552326.1 flp pilus-assembly TadE/G-like family protein [Frankia sp. AgB1.9]MBL7622079.1 flp pilus-assembly TadE/G-like family protein [Frankia sp. AgB1.8]
MSALTRPERRRRARSAPPDRRSAPPGNRNRDRGSATVLLLGWLLVVATVGAILLAVGAVTLARRQAATGADLAALAGAMDRTGDPAVVCAQARRFAARNGTDLLACRVGGGAVEVVAAARLPPVLGGFGPLTATARAGPWIGTQQRPTTGPG